MADAACFSEDFKLCGFLPLVVAVVRCPPCEPLPSCSPLVSFPCSSASLCHDLGLPAEAAPKFSEPTVVRALRFSSRDLQDISASKHGFDGVVSNSDGGRLWQTKCRALCDDIQQEPSILNEEALLFKSSQEEDWPESRSGPLCEEVAMSLGRDFPFENFCYTRRKRSSLAKIKRNHVFLEDPLEKFIGAECWLTGEGSEVQFHASGGFVLSPIAFPKKKTGMEDGSPVVDETESTPPVHVKKACAAERGSSGKKQKRPVLAGGGNHILNNLQVLTVRNGVSLKAHVVEVARREDNEVRAVVLLDLYLPSFLWSGRNYWKPSPAFTAIINHLSCDWEARKQFLRYNGQKVNSGISEEFWVLGDCQVLGCKLHYKIDELERRKRFDMHAIFKSLPSLKGERIFVTSVHPAKKTGSSGLWDIPNEVLVSIFSKLLPRDLQSVACTCRHIRELALYIMPCINLKLFPHQQAAVCWMLQRELHPMVLMHPLYKDIQTEDGFHFYLNCVSGDLSPEVPPNVMDFRGGLFCDEPGLGKTVTALSLILKTQGTLSTPPEGAHVRWCEHSSGDRYGYYEINSNRVTSIMKRCMDLKAKHNRVDGSPSSKSSTHHLSTLTRILPTGKRAKESLEQGFHSSGKPLNFHPSNLGPAPSPSTGVKRNLLEAYDVNMTVEESLKGLAATPNAKRKMSLRASSSASFRNCFYEEDIWVQCDSCDKWRKVTQEPDEELAWFCNMNKDPLRQNCSDPEENWECGPISSLPGFYKIGGAAGLEQNVIHFANVLKECASLRDVETNDALRWLSNLKPEKLAQMCSTGVCVPPSLHVYSCSEDQHKYSIIFQRFGLVPRRERGKGLTKLYYPPFLDGLIFDLPALKEALSKPLDAVRLYLSRATLIVVPANLIDHWRNQISRHTKPGQLRVCVFGDQKNAPKVQDLAWNYDIVITTFSRLSCEWAYKENSILMSVHWLRIILDEGHTLGASLTLTNKLQMATSMHASRRWVLTGTPTPHTPNSQVAHLQPMLKFLHEDIFGKNHKLWEGGILKPFEAGSEEGHARLIGLLQRCMISARKSDLCTIPPCIRKITLIDFTQKHAESYNELVETVRRNILMADWNDPSHVESLLNPKQWKFRSTTIKNVRLSCCVAGHIKVHNAGEDIQETMEIFAQQGMDPASLEYALIKNALLVGANCNRCGEWCRLPIITPCKHLLCLGCVALDKEKCTLFNCGNPYKMQSPEDLTRPENPNPKWPVPQDLIELQPSYVQDNWDPDWQATSSSKVTYLVERLKELKGVPAYPAGEVNLSDPSQSEGERSADKESYEKAIVFSQFLEHIHVIERQLAKAGIKVAGMYSPMHSVNKTKSLLAFQNDKDCMVLLMDGSAALGLDLSFVTRVFLMEPIWDRSMEEQVVSRAHRMGATRPVLVETLAMRGTIEEQMLQFLQDPAEHSRAVQQDKAMAVNSNSSLKTVHDFAESSYLAQLSFVRTKI